MADTWTELLARIWEFVKPVTIHISESLCFIWSSLYCPRTHVPYYYLISSCRKFFPAPFFFFKILPFPFILLLPLSPTPKDRYTIYRVSSFSFVIEEKRSTNSVVHEPARTAKTSKRLKSRVATIPLYKTFLLVSGQLNAKAHTNQRLFRTTNNCIYSKKLEPTRLVHNTMLYRRTNFATVNIAEYQH